MPRGNGNGNGNGNGKAPERKVPVQTPVKPSKSSQAVSPAPAKAPLIPSKGGSTPSKAPEASAKRPTSAPKLADIKSAYSGQKAITPTGRFVTSKSQHGRGRSPSSASDKSLPSSRSTSPTERMLTDEELVARERSKFKVIEKDAGGAQIGPRSRPQLDALGANHKHALIKLGKNHSEAELKKLGLDEQDIALALGNHPQFNLSTHTTKAAIRYRLSDGAQAHREQHIKESMRPRVGTGETEMCSKIPNTPSPAHTSIARRQVAYPPNATLKFEDKTFHKPASLKCNCDNPACKQGVTTEGPIACAGCGQTKMTTDSVSMNAVLKAAGSAANSITQRDTSKKINNRLGAFAGGAAVSGNQSGSNNPAGKATSSNTTHVKGGKPGSSRKT